MTSRDLSVGGGGETVCVVTIRSPAGVPSDPWENTDAWKCLRVAFLYEPG